MTETSLRTAKYGRLPTHPLILFPLQNQKQALGRTTRRELPCFLWQIVRKPDAVSVPPQIEHGSPFDMQTRPTQNREMIRPRKHTSRDIVENLEDVQRPNHYEVRGYPSTPFIPAFSGCLPMKFHNNMNIKLIILASRPVPVNEVHRIGQSSASFLQSSTTCSYQNLSKIS